MAQFEITGLEGLIARLQAIGQGADEAMSAAVEAGAEYMVGKLKEAVPVRTGALRDHIKISKRGHDATEGYWAEIMPVGSRPGGGKPNSRRYATIGYVLEHGRSNMRARPWMAPTMERERARTLEIMEAELKRRMGLD